MHTIFNVEKEAAWMKKTAKECISTGSFHIKFQQYIKDYHVSFKNVLSCALSLSYVQLFVTPWTVAFQALLSMGILQARILEWVAKPSPGDLPIQELKWSLLHCRQILYHLNYQGSLVLTLLITKCETLDRQCIYLFLNEV